jgi:hypothetical protein
MGLKTGYVENPLKITLVFSPGFKHHPRLPIAEMEKDKLSTPSVQVTLDDGEFDS